MMEVKIIFDDESRAVLHEAVRSATQDFFLSGAVDGIEEMIKEAVTDRFKALVQDAVGRMLPSDVISLLEKAVIGAVQERLQEDSNRSRGASEQTQKAKK